MNLDPVASIILTIAHPLIVVAIALRVIMRRPATGVALAWLLMVAVFPIAGALAYLLVGERRIGQRRARGIDTLRADYKSIADAAMPADFTEVDWSRHAPAAAGMNRLGRNMGASATVTGSRLRSSPTPRPS